MLRLSIFGGLVLHQDGQLHIGPAAHRRRLALLAVIAAAGRRGVGRERPLARSPSITFWPMRPLAIVGLILLILGGFVLLRGLSFSSRTSVIKVGDFQATVDERREVPPWVGGLALAGGVVLLVAAGRRRG